MSHFSVHEFRPTILFLVKFIGLYLVGNLTYGLYITSYYPSPDPATHYATSHTAEVLSGCGFPVSISDHSAKPVTLLAYKNNPVLSVYEGCNGLNIMIIFVAFTIAFGPYTRNLVWFIPLGLGIIHAMNLLRISLLMFVSLYRPHYMYFTHKYLFTAFLYFIIFLLWIWWVKKFSLKTT